MKGKWLKSFASGIFRSVFESEHLILASSRSKKKQLGNMSAFQVGQGAFSNYLTRVRLCLFQTVGMNWKEWIPVPRRPALN